MNTLILKLSIAVLAAAAAQQPADAFYLKNGDRVVFYGDSITAQGLYTELVETYVVTRFPGMAVTFVNSGESGERVSGGRTGWVEERLKRDVAAYRPTVVTVMLGMNDGCFRYFDKERYTLFYNGYQRILRTLKGALPGVRLFAIQPSAYDDYTRTPLIDGGYNAVLLRYGLAVKEIAAAEGADSVDFNRPLIALLKTASRKAPGTADTIIPDRIHPAYGGHLVLAGALLRAWGAPALVSEVELDAAVPKVTAVRRSSVSLLKSDGAVSWTQLDEALPMPLESSAPAAALALRFSDFVRDLNRQQLKVTGLSKARYNLFIDNTLVGGFSRKELSEGINLGAVPTPMSEQAKAVHILTRRHNEIHAKRLHAFQLPLKEFTSAEVRKAAASLLAALDSEEAGVVRAQRAAARPLPRRFRLVPAE